MSGDQLAINVSCVDAAKKLTEYLRRNGHDFEVSCLDMIYCSWPEVFGSTAGPFGGIGGQAMTTFRMEAWMYDQWAVVFCGIRIVYVGEFSIGARWRSGK